MPLAIANLAMRKPPYFLVRPSSVFFHPLLGFGEELFARKGRHDFECQVSRGRDVPHGVVTCMPGVKLVKDRFPCKYVAVT